MKKGHIINGELLKRLSSVGYGDLILICGATFPIPADIPVIDLAVSKDLPTTATLLALLGEEMDYDYVTVAEELERENDVFHRAYQELIGDAGIEKLTFRQFKVLVKNVKFAVRTGDMGVHTQIILRSGPRG